MRRLLLVAVLTMSLGGCDSGSPGPQVSPAPYAVTAIDYHFHDAHPSLPISPDRTVVFVNGGRNIHNVTIVGANYSRDLPVGERLVIDPISSVLPEEGLYDFYCSYHRDRKMEGVLVIEG